MLAIMLDSQALLTVLEDWNYWNKPLPETVLRNVTLPKHLQNDLVLVIQGVRRCGKSTLLTQLMRYYRLNPDACVLVNFEDPRLASTLTFEILQQIVQVAYQRLPKAKKYYFFFDEIQNVECWQKWLYSQLERPGPNHFIITGSNASLLSGELGTTLTGRHKTLELYPFSFLEFRSVFQNASLQQYLEQGGFPKVVLAKEEGLLQEYFNDIVERDIRERLRARSGLPLRQLLQMVFESCGSEISLRKLAGACGLTADTVGLYLHMAESAYLIGSCPYFAYSAKQQSIRNKKYYAIDTALRQAVITQTGKDWGKKLETIVFFYLKRQYLNVYYWRGKGEVDFVTHSKDGITPYQVSWEGGKARHEVALTEFYAQHRDANEAIFIHQDNAESFLMTNIS